MKRGSGGFILGERGEKDESTKGENDERRKGEEGKRGRIEMMP